MTANPPTSGCFGLFIFCFIDGIKNAHYFGTNSATNSLLSARCLLTCGSHVSNPGVGEKARAPIYGAGDLNLEPLGHLLLFVGT